MRRSQTEGFSIKFGVIRRKFLDFQKLVLFNAGKILTRIGRRPPDFDIENARTFSQADMLLEWRGAKRASAANSATYRTRRFAFIFDRQFDARANRRAVAFDSD